MLTALILSAVIWGAVETPLPNVRVTADDVEITESCTVIIPPGTVIEDTNGDGVIHIAASDIEVRFATSVIEEWVFADFYEWMKYHMSCWDYYADRRLDTWPLSEKLQHGLDRFLVMTADPQGRVHITQQRLWASGVKKGSGL